MEPDLIQTLQHWIAQQQRLPSPEECQALLAGGGPLRERNLLQLVLQENIPAELLSDAELFPLKGLLDHMQQRLEDQWGLRSEWACWAIESWAMALGLIQPVLAPEEQMKQAIRGWLAQGSLTEAQKEEMEALRIQLSLDRAEASRLFLEVKWEMGSAAEADSASADGGVSPGQPPAPTSFTNTLGMKFISVQPGTFLMGSPPTEKNRLRHETQHRVTLTQPFYIQTTLVTQAQWQAVMGNNPSFFQQGGMAPVDSVSWHDAQAFIARINTLGEGIYRLPTEAEWEYCCRAGATSAYFFGETADELSQYAWHFGNAQGTTHPVGEKQPNPWGLYDILGNLWEWCQDEFDDYTAAPAVDPLIDNQGQARVFRGGSWFNEDISYFRCANRYYVDASHRDSNFGLRLIRAA